MEVIVAGKIQYEALLPALIASYTAAYTSHTLGLENFMCRLRIHLRYQMLVWLSGSLCLESFLD